MGQCNGVHAVLHLRKMRGGSQPVMVRASDGFFYIVKFLNNLQGSNVLFNEAVGTELFRGAGLPVTEWRPVFVSEDFIARTPSCWMETEHGQLRPNAGWCFGSRYLGLRNSDIFEILPGQSFSRIENRKDFWTAWVLDVLSGHSDNRQAVFIERDSGTFGAHFIDHGHLFGGADGSQRPSVLRPRYIDSRMYPQISADDAAEILRAIQAIDLAAISRVACGLPTEWKSDEAISGFERFARRFSDPVLVKNIVRSILQKPLYAKGSYVRRLEREPVRFNSADLRNQILPSGVDSRHDSREGGLACGRRRIGTQSLCASCPQGAGF